MAAMLMAGGACSASCSIVLLEHLFTHGQTSSVCLACRQGRQTSCQAVHAMLETIVAGLL